ncbi:uncharacterized protein LOC118599391 [Oryzias melastigma]|uniref:uncharacterized protein LOC118599391 n=1 Tax=Oryzias melastigma TaxID=30732 RepID=UPI00168D938E|nr:uncharacterized protein LOC118599391 [Oryzias melastigma]
MDGLVRFNEDRAAAAAPPPAAEDHLRPLHSYSDHLKHALNQKSQRVLGHHLVKDFTKPAAYTGEQSQTGSVLEGVSGDPDAPDEAAAVIALQDEGIEEDEDPTISGPVLLSSDAAAWSGDPADTDRSAPLKRMSVPEEVQGPDGQPGYQHVLRLTKALVEIRSLPAISNSRVDLIVALWERLPESDKQRVVYPARHRDRQPKGRFKAAKGKSTSCPGKESLQRGLLGLNASPANWPDASRLVEAICSQLCRLHPSATRTRGVLKTRWSLVLGDYVAIREAVLGSPRLMAQTGLQLFQLNQRTPSQWFSTRQKKWEKAVLEQQEVGLLPAAPAVSLQLLPEAKRLSSIQVGQGQPFDYGTPEEKLPLPLLRPAPPAPPPPPPLPPPPPPPPLPPPGERVPRTTAFRRRKAAEAAAAAQEGHPAGTKVRRQTVQYTCTKCGQPKRLDTGHTRIDGVSYCAAVGGKTVQEWTEEMKKKIKINTFMNIFLLLFCSK